MFIDVEEALFTTIGTFMNYRIITFIMLIASATMGQTIIDISVKGISDGKNDGAQKDREEAITDAKRQACEKAGLTIESKTTIKDFKLLSDYVETQSKGVLLPGFQIVDVGYVADGTYQVVLSGKIKSLADEAISSKELRYAKALYDKGNIRQCSDILEGYIDSKDEKIPEATKEDAYYYFIKWGFPFRPADALEKFAAYYPESKHLDALKAFVPFTEKVLCSYKKECTAKFAQWQKKAVTIEDKKFDQILPAVKDTLIFTDYKNAEHSLVVEYFFLQSTVKDAQYPFAYSYFIYHYSGNIKKGAAKGGEPARTAILEEFNPYTETENLRYEASRSDILFGYFKLTDYQLNGGVPTKKGDYPQKLTFAVYQVSF
jgi:hypothetical protein